MKLLMESWNRYLVEDKEVLEEGWKENLALMLALFTASPNIAQAGAPADSAPTHQVDQPAEGALEVMEAHVLKQLALKAKNGDTKAQSQLEAILNGMKEKAPTKYEAAMQIPLVAAQVN